jgi:hypothetical protein
MPRKPYTLNRGPHLARQLHFRQWVRLSGVNERIKIFRQPSSLALAVSGPRLMAGFLSLQI